MKDLISRLEKWLAVNRFDYIQYLQPGLSAEEILSAEEELRLGIPEELRILYSWRNGQSSTIYQSLQDNWMYMDMDSVKEAYAVLNELYELGDFELENWWSPQWIPFLSNGGGDHMCLDLEGTFTGKKGQFIEFRHDDAMRVIAYPNLTTWLQILVESLESGYWNIDSEISLTDQKLAKLTENTMAGYPMIYFAEQK